MHGQDLQENAYPPIAINLFKNEISIDDIVIVTDGNLKFRAIGRVTGDYEHAPDLDYPHLRSVQWLRVFEESLPYEQLMNNRFSQMTLYYLSPKSIRTEALYSLVNPIREENPGSTVLIIDEINRGNISKILGELITLLEPDKRLGQANEIRVRLPYSGKDFGVPSNLFIIGTMNTADRSLAHIDTALRRRFTFTEIMPKPSILKSVEVRGEQVDVQKLLTVMNQRIKVLADRDHMIGHSYFMQDVSLSAVFRDRVIPLLTEYFFEDWSKVRAVLADDQTEDQTAQFITEEEVNSELFKGGNLRYKKKVYSRNDTALTNPKAYQKIYSQIESE